MDEHIENKELDKIKVFSSDDEKLKILGELLSNKSSRDIIRLLIDKEMYVNEIAKKLELRPNLVIHHLQKMESIDLAEIKNKKITRKGEEHRFFKIRSGMLIFPNKIESETNRGFLKKIFREGVKFTVIAFVGLASWFVSVNTFQRKDETPITFELEDVTNKTADIIKPEVIDSDINFFLIPIIIIGSSLFLIWFSRKCK